VVGRSPGDEVIEAIELQGHRFGVGVHWHPEEGDDPRLLTALVNAATVASASQRKDVQARKVQAKAKAAARTR
jgi:gamma-glutamyl-gamma-aminobutyrate hydrolase PuuD